MAFFAPQVDDGGQNGDRNHGDNDERKVAVELIRGKTACQEVSGQGDTSGPQESADQIETQEACVMHLGGTSHNWREGANERHETGQHDSLATMFFVEVICG